jgi:hypothetical protein
MNKYKTMQLQSAQECRLETEQRRGNVRQFWHIREVFQWIIQTENNQINYVITSVYLLLAHHVETRFTRNKALQILPRDSF